MSALVATDAAAMAVDPSVARTSPWNADELYRAVVDLDCKLRAAINGRHPLVLSFADVLRLERVIGDLARLASETPRFSNPIEVWNAKALRDHILEELV